jgi:hypothetical protein
MRCQLPFVDPLTRGAGRVCIEQLLGLLDEGQPLGHTRQAEQPFHLLAASDDGEAAPGFDKELMCVDDDAEPGGIHEHELAKVDDHELGACIMRARQLCTQRWAGREVELTAYRDHDRGPVSTRLDLKVVLHDC